MGEGLGEAQEHWIRKKRGENGWEGEGPEFGSDPKELTRRGMCFTTEPAPLPEQSLGMSGALGNGGGRTGSAQGQLFLII